MSVKKYTGGSGMTEHSRTHVGLANVNFRAGGGQEEMDAIRKMLQAAGTNQLTEARTICKIVANEYWSLFQAVERKVAESKTQADRKAALAGVPPMPEVDSPEYFAAGILNELDRADKCEARGELDEAKQAYFQAGVNFGVVGMKLRWEADTIKGGKFGPKKDRSDDLGKALEPILDDLGDDADPRAVWDELMARADNGEPPFDVVIPDIVDSEKWSWKSQSTGKEKPLTLELVKRRLRNLKKKRQERRPPSG